MALKHTANADGAHKTANVFVVEDVPATGDRWTREEAGFDYSADSQGTIGSKKTRERRPKGGKQPKARVPAVPWQTRMMENHEVFNPVDALKKTEVKGLDWGSAPGTQMAVARAIIHKRRKKVAHCVEQMDMNTKDPAQRRLCTLTLKELLY